MAQRREVLQFGLDADDNVVENLPLPVDPREAARYADLHVAGPLLHNAYRETTGSPFPTAIIWWTNSGKTAKITELLVTRDSQKKPTVEQIKVYKADGTTVLYTVTDTITYTGSFEASRVRTVV